MKEYYTFKVHLNEIDGRMDSSLQNTIHQILNRELRLLALNISRAKQSISFRYPYFPQFEYPVLRSNTKTLNK